MPLTHLSQVNDSLTESQRLVQEVLEDKRFLDSEGQRRGRNRVLTVLEGVRRNSDAVASGLLRDLIAVGGVSETLRALRVCAHSSAPLFGSTWIT